ncbi:MAG: hypothetical protein K1060chlam1_00785 [Candidatus Anoxychlamydiales bacterium]|nr:hypothetical protein [Candidatus Anoxychlamydiales bacterium]
MKNFITKYLAIVTIFLASFAFANENRIETSSRELTENEKKELIEQEKQEFSSTENKVFSQAIYNNQYPPLVFNQTIHNLVGVSVLCDYLIIEDGSEWNIKSGYFKEVFSWQEHDPIVIVKNDSFYSSYFHGYKYKMINANTNTSVEVKMQLNPISDNPYTLQIAAINPTTCEVILTDNSLWECDPSQKRLLEKWIAQDGIIIGTNSKGWFNNTYDNFLINVRIKDYALQEIKANRVE